MLLPGLKKLGNQLGFKRNGDYCYGYVKNCFVTLFEGKNVKMVGFRTPVVIDEDDKQKFLSWQKKGYASQILFSEDPSRYVEFSFPERFWPYKISKIKEVIEDMVNYMAEKYPDVPFKCSCSDCEADENTPVHIYELNGEPTPLCEKCAKEINQNFEVQNDAINHVPDNYLQGALAAAVASVPGILVSLLFYHMGKIAAVTGLVYYFLATQGYNWAKGKMDKIGVIIISAVSLAFSAIGTYVGYLIDVTNGLTEFEVYSTMPFLERLEVASTIIQDPEVQTELNGELAKTLILCGACIVYSMHTSWKSVGKSKIKQLD